MSLPDVRGAATAQGSLGRDRGRTGYRRVHAPVRGRGTRTRPTVGTLPAAAPYRRPDFEGNPGAAGLSAIRGTGLFNVEPFGGDALRRRKSAYPAGNANRFFPHGRAVYSRRAVHRTAPARQRQTACDTPRLARPRKYVTCRRTRRGHHAGGGLSHRHWPRRGRTRRGSRGGGDAPRSHEQSKQSDGAIPVGRTPHSRSGGTPSRQRKISARTRRGRKQSQTH